MQMGRRIQQILASLPVQNPLIQEGANLIDSAMIHLEEADDRLRQALDRTELDPQRLEQVEQRLSAIFQLARKYRRPPEQLAAYHQEIRAEYEQLENPAARIQALAQQTGEAEAAYMQTARKLSTSRQAAAERMSADITRYFHQLAMPGASMDIQLASEESHAGPGGIDRVAFLIRTNPGQTPGPLAKVASGGELSRVSLAIQMVTAGRENTPVLIFDEVDAGIGGATAATVGDMLRSLGERAQVICVTHLAQVACKAQHQLRVEKLLDGELASTLIQPLDADARVQEIARMLGGQINRQSLQHAEQLLET